MLCHLKNFIHYIETDRSKLEDLIYDLSEKINNLSCELSLKNSERSALQKQIENLNEKTKILNKELEEKEKILAENANIKSEIFILKDKIKEKERNYIKVKFVKTLLIH